MIHVRPETSGAGPPAAPPVPELAHPPRPDTGVDVGGPSPAPGGIVRGTETILVVEDGELLRRVARRVLERAGYRVLVAADGDEAVRLVEAGSPPVDLVFTDLVMPGMSGHILVDRLRATHPTLRIVLTSGYTDESAGLQGLLDRGFVFLDKPYSVVDLTHTVRQVLDA